MRADVVEVRSDVHEWSITRENSDRMALISCARGGGWIPRSFSTASA